MRAFRKYDTRGYSVPELLMVLVIMLIAATLGMFGVSRNLKGAKTAEARNALGRISLSAQDAYERDLSLSALVPLGSTASTGSHVLCESSTPVPMDGSVPSARKYTPNNAPGNDFNTGTGTSGWKCLRFEMYAPTYFAYQYVNDGPYFGPSLGAPNIGPNGFEASARGNLDGDNVTSLFTLSGQVEPTGTLNRTTQIFIHDEFE